MNKYVALFYGSYDESNWYEGFEANSKEELVHELNLQLELKQSENEKYQEYEEEACKIFDDQSISDAVKNAAYNELLDKCPYEYYIINPIRFDESRIFLFPDEFWEHVTKKKV